VRAIAVGVAIFLIAVASASGALQHTLSPGLAQKALEAPHRVFAGQFVCRSAGSCVGIGGSSMLVEHRGKWSAVNSPLPPHPGTGASVNLHSLACPAAGRCVASGIYGEQRAIVLTQSGRRWRIAVVSLPSDAQQHKGVTGPWPGLGSVSCGSAGNCVAVGYYGASDGATDALLVSEQHGSWGTGTDVQLPSDAATTSPLPDEEATPGGFLSSVACPSAGSCSAVGSYTRKDVGAGTYGSYPWELDRSGAKWATRGQSLQLPADAATTRDYRGGASPFMGFTGLSCPSAGNCTAIGGYVDRHHDFQGVIFTQRAGKWSQGIRAPVPAGAVPNNDPMELDDPMNSVSCATPDDCAAVGWFSVDQTETPHGLLLAERGGSWKASKVVLPPGVRASEGVFLTSVGCAPRGICVAVGYWTGNGRTHGLIVRERGGRWGRAVKAALPPNAAQANNWQHTFLNTVACPAARFCLAGGYYADRSHHTQGLLLSLRFR
jgi:hypothetical protein